MSKQTDFDTEVMTAEQLAAANERLAKIPGVGTQTFADAGKPNPLRANRKASLDPRITAAFDILDYTAGERDAFKFLHAAKSKAVRTSFLMALSLRQL